MDLPNALGIGETINCEFEVTDKRDLESREDAGLVVVDTIVTNQDDELKLEGDMKFLFKKRSHYGDDPDSP